LRKTGRQKACLSFYPEEQKNNSMGKDNIQLGARPWDNGA
jgi:hypothetical protein